MFNSKTVSFKDDIFTYDKFPVITPDRCVIAEHVIIIGIERWCISLVSALRYTLEMLCPTLRMSTTESDIKTSDKKIMGSRLVLELGCVHLDSQADYNRFRLYRKDPISAMEDGSTFRYFDTYDIEFTKVAKDADGAEKVVASSKDKNDRILNRAELAGLEIGSYIEVTGEVNRYNIINGGARHRGITLFARDIKYDKNKIGKSYSGTLTIKYEDNVAGKDVIKSALKQILDIVTTVLEDDNLKMDYGNYSIEIDNDRSCILCGLIDHYMVMCSDDIIFTNKKNINNKAIMSFSNIEEAELKVVLGKVVAAIKGDITGIINNLA